MPLNADRRSVISVALLLALALGACMHWSGTRPPYQEHLRAHERHRVRVHLKDGMELTLDSARVEGDSLIGQVALAGRTVQADSQGLRRSVPLSRIERLEIRKTNVGGTVLLAAGGALLFATLVAAAASAGEPTGSRIDTMQTCPLAYSWDGEAWRLDSGTFGGAIMEPLARTQVDGMRHLRGEGGVARVRLSSELNETDMVDAAELVAVDHPPRTTVAPDQHGRIRGLRGPVPPVAARDDRGRDVMPLLRRRDARSWSSDPWGRDTARVSDLRSGVELAFVRPPGTTEARLVVDGRNSLWAAALLSSYVAMHGRVVDAWYDSVNANPRRARRFGELVAREAFLRVELATPGGWVTVGAVQEAGPEVSREQVVPLDLAVVRGDTVRVRLTAAPSFWVLDRVAMDFGREPQHLVRRLGARLATDRAGQDVSAALRAADGRYFVGQKGDRVDLVFDVPAVPAGMVRSYVLETTGWYRIHAAAVGEPDSAALRRIDRDPSFVAKFTVSHMNAALSLLASASR
jgi:hypothetical protein